MRNTPLAYIFTKYFALIRERYALIRERYAFIRDSYALIRESFSFIRESTALIREKYNFSLRKWDRWALAEAHSTTTEIAKEKRLDVAIL